MKKVIIWWVIMYASLLVVWYAQMIVPSSENYILTDTEWQVLHSSGIGDPLRDWAYNIIQPETWTGALSWVVGVGEQISSHQNAQGKVLDIVKKIINVYILWMLALVALVYLLYHGFLIVSAAGDETQYKKWLSGVKYAAIAILGIGISWLVVSWIFRIIALVIWP
jgi:hypothetical protein